MSDDTKLTRATPAELPQSLAYALRFDDRGKAHSRNREIMAQIAAETLMRHLERAGYVIMKKPAAVGHGDPRSWPGGGWVP